jgi:hypothetical protein
MLRLRYAFFNVTHLSVDRRALFHEWNVFEESWTLPRLVEYLEASLRRRREGHLTKLPLLRIKPEAFVDIQIGREHGQPLKVR